ncbi:MAG: hypothetical protein H6737_21660 [Alphaproteobacteria bacterium]|nr:hypothetical protein [Alphaproteobacteria bacterium]
MRNALLNRAEPDSDAGTPAVEPAEVEVVRWMAETPVPPIPRPSWLPPEAPPKRVVVVEKAPAGDPWRDMLLAGALSFSVTSSLILLSSL